MPLRCDFLNQGDSWDLHYIQHGNIFLPFLNWQRYRWNMCRKTIANFCYFTLLRCFDRNHLIVIVLLNRFRIVILYVLGSKRRQMVFELTIFKEVSNLFFHLLSELIFIFLLFLYHIIFKLTVFLTLLIYCAKLLSSLETK